MPGSVHRCKKWSPPAEDYHKIHVDAAVLRQDTRGALATICRSHEGIFVGASAMVIQGMNDPEILEGLALREAFSLAGDLNIKKVQVVTDCKSLVNNLNIDYRGPSSVIIRDIKTSMWSFEDAKVEHEMRESNEEAHSLAKAALSPPEIACIPDIVPS